MINKLYTRKTGNILYELRYFEGDHKYVVYKWDIEKSQNGVVEWIPEEATFNNEDDAKKYIDSL